jgi:hypothetical protein
MRDALVALWIALAPSLAQAQECPDDGATWVAVTATLGAAAGATGALAVSGGLTADEGRDFSFLVGSLAGIGVTAGLSVIYGTYDGLTGCRMAGSSIAWSVPIAMLIVGSLIPVGVWAGSDEVVVGEAPAALVPQSGRLTVRF